MPDATPLLQDASRSRIAASHGSKKRELPWADLAGVKVVNRFVAVSGTKGTSARLASRDVWNAPALLLLCDRHNTTRQRG